MTAEAERWERIERSARLLTEWHVGYDPLRGEPPSEEWLPVAAQLSLALWRAALDAGIWTDDVPLTRGHWWLEGQRHAELHAPPYPPGPPISQRALGPADWSPIAARDRELLYTARDVLLHHVVTAVREDYAIRADDSPSPPLLLSDRRRAVASSTTAGLTTPWEPDIARARARITAAEQALREGVWRPDSVERQVTRDMLSSTLAAPAGAWIERLMHLIETARRLHTMSGPLVRLPMSDPRYSLRLTCGMVLTTVGQIVETAAELDTLWALRDPTQQVVQDWERQRFPLQLRRHVDALESMMRAFAELLAAALRTDN